MNFSIEKNSTVSIYPTADQPGYAKVQNGELPSGKKLPTVRELADQLGIARGTVKHAYEELERKGIITMTQAAKEPLFREQARQESQCQGARYGRQSSDCWMKWNLCPFLHRKYRCFLI